MQTFLPYADFAKTAQVLDRQRLGKQRVENLQIVKAIVTGTGWVNHPATKMWRDHLGALIGYQYSICFEWSEIRGYRDTCFAKTMALVDDIAISGSLPDWLGDEALHLSHRSNLLRKAPDHYGPLFEADLTDDLPYVWPV